MNELNELMDKISNIIKVTEKKFRETSIKEDFSCNFENITLSWIKCPATGKMRIYSSTKLVDNKPLIEQKIDVRKNSMIHFDEFIDIFEEKIKAKNKEYILFKENLNKLEKRISDEQ